MAHRTEQADLMTVFQSGTHLSAEMNEAMQIKYLALGHNILMLPSIELSIFICSNRLLAVMIIQMTFDLSIFLVGGSKPVFRLLRSCSLELIFAHFFKIVCGG